MKSVSNEHVTEDVFESTALLFSPLFQGKESICLWHPCFIQESQGIWDLTACMPWKLKGGCKTRHIKLLVCHSFIVQKGNIHTFAVCLWVYFLLITPNTTAVHAVQFLCNFGAALKEKCLLMCMSYLLASFFISCLSIFDSFSLLVLINFHVSNILVKKEKNCHFDTFPPPFTICAGVLDVKQEAKQWRIWGPKLGKVWNLVWIDMQ